MSHNFVEWREFRGTTLYRESSGQVIRWVTADKAVDADGAPNAYHPDDKGLDYLANAGYPNTSWWDKVLAVDPANPSKPTFSRLALSRDISYR